MPVNASNSCMLQKMCDSAPWGNTFWWVAEFGVTPGPATYTLIRNLVSPAKPSSKTYDQIKPLMKEHFNTKPSEIVERY